MIGEILGQRYELLEKIGEGGMALVYKAKDLLLSRPVAVKVLRAQYASDTEFVERFRREAQTAASLSHPHVVSIYDVGEERGIHFIVMEYIEGENLKDRIRRQGRLDPVEAADIAAQICDALGHAHRRGLIHRDVKPHNILLTVDGRIKVTDFGIARAASNATLTETGIVIGSVHYFSPEQARGKEVGTRSDLYSVGVVLYEMLSGNLPFQGESPISIALKQIQESPQPLRQIPLPLQSILARALEKDPLRRFARAEDLQRALEVFVREEGGRTLPRVREPVGQVEAKRGGEGVSRKPKKRRDKEGGSRWGVVLGVLFMGLFLGLAGMGMVMLPRFFQTPEVVVPQVVGLSRPEAEEALRSKGLRMGVAQDMVYDPLVPFNHVTHQTPAAGRTVKANRIIEVTLSQGPRMVTVPTLEGLSLREATIVAASAGLFVREEQEVAHEEVAPGVIIRQIPAPGQRVQEGVDLILVISTGPPAQGVVLPRLIGSYLDEARNRLEDMGLRLGTVHEDETADAEPWQVLDQNPWPESWVELGSTVDLIISKFTESKPQVAPGERKLIRKPVTVGFLMETARSQEVRVVVIDAYGTREEYRRVHRPQERVELWINTWGYSGQKDVTVQVYVGGELWHEETL